MKGVLESLGYDSESFFESVASVCNDYLYVWDFSNDAFWTSPNMERDFGITGLNLTEYVKWWIGQIHKRDRERIEKMFADFLRSEETDFTVEYQMLTANGTYVWVGVKSKVKREAGTGSPLILLGAMKNLEQYDGIDYVTGLLKYGVCKARFENTFEGRTDFHSEILLVGIDDFTTINTLNSHSFGDMVLRASAQDIQKMLPEGANIYRYEGDQFLISGSGMTRKQILEVYDRIKQYTEGHHKAEGQSYRFTVSAGVVSYPEDGRSWSDLEKGAATALKIAKKSGKNRCVELKTEMLEERINTTYLNSCMVESVDHNFSGFWLAFQPVCNVENLNIHGAEALLRYKMPDGTPVFPDQFIPLLEESRLIVQVGLWVLEQAIITCKAWTAKIPDFVMNVNVSYIQLKDASFCQRAAELLEQYELNVKNLTLELTESYFVTDDVNINQSLEFLRKLKIQLAMDDFGTGYSTFGRLAGLDVDVIKIDKVFVKSLHTSPYNQDFVDSVIRLCHNLGKVVCIEGVETREEWESIYLLNADYIQGYYVSRPVDDVTFFEHYIVSATDHKSLFLTIGKEKIQKELANDKKLLFAMMNASPLCMILWSRDCEILSCNEATVTLFGAMGIKDFIDHFYRYSPQEQPDGRSTEQMIHDNIGATLTCGRSSFKWMHCDEKGRLIPAEVTCVRIPYQNDYIVASYTRDLRAELAMAEQDKKFRRQFKALLDATPLCLNLWNTKYENLMCNKEAVKLFDLESEQEYLDRFFELSPERQPDGQLSSEAARCKISEAMEAGRIQFNWMHCKLNGELIPAEITLVRMESLDDDGSVMVAGYTRDLRAQIKAEKSLRTTSGYIRAVIDANPLACMICNIHGQALECNQLAVELLGAENKEEILHGNERFLPRHQPDGSLSVEKGMEKFREVIEKGRCVFNWIYFSRDHKEIPCEVTMVRTAVKEGEEDIIIAFSRDQRSGKR